MMTCATCNEAKSADGFYVSNRRRCKECVKAAVRENYRRNRTRYQRYERRRERTHSRQLFKVGAQLRHRTKHPLKYKARTALNNAVRDGRLLRESCEICGTTERVHAHHEDYAKPLDVRWLCKNCHWRQHGGVAAA